MLGDGVVKYEPDHRDSLPVPAAPFLPITPHSARIPALRETPVGPSRQPSSGRATPRRPAAGAQQVPSLEPDRDQSDHRRGQK